LYGGSSHSYLQNLYGSSHSYLQNLEHQHHPGHVQQDYDSKKDVFQTQNIGIGKIESAKNVDISLLQNLYGGSSHSYLQNLYGSSHSYLQNLEHHHHPMMHVQQDQDSKKDVFQTQNIGIGKIESAKNVDISLLQNLYGGSSHSYLQNLYGSSHSYLQNLYGSSHSYLQNLEHQHHPMHVQQDHDSAHDLFQTQNIGIKDIEAKGNVDITLQNLAAPGMTDWWYI